MMRRRDRIRACVVMLAFALTLGVVGATAEPTQAAFTDDEYVAVSVGANLAPPTNVRCTASLLVVTFRWDPPETNAAAVTSYTWQLQGVSLLLGAPTSGTTGTATNQRVVTGALAVAALNATFSVRAVANGPGWTSVPTTLTFSSVLGLGC